MFRRFSHTHTRHSIIFPKAKKASKPMLLGPALQDISPRMQLKYNVSNIDWAQDIMNTDDSAKPYLIASKNHILNPMQLWELYNEYCENGSLQSISREEWYKIMDAIAWSNIEERAAKFLSMFVKFKECGNHPEASVHSALLFCLREDPQQALITHQSIMHNIRKTKLLKPKLATDLYSNTSIKILLYVLFRLNKTHKIHEKKWRFILKTDNPFDFSSSLVERLWQDAIETKVHFNLDTILAFLECFGYSKNSQMVEIMCKRLARDFPEKKWSLKVFEGLMKAHYEVDKFELVEDFYKRYSKVYPQPSLTAVSLYLNSSFKLQHYKEICLLAKNKLNGRYLDNKSYLIIIKAFLKLNDYDNISIWLARIDEHMKKLHSDNPIDFTFYKKLLEIFCESDRLELSESIFKKYCDLRAQTLTRMNKESGMSFTTLEMAQIFHSESHASQAISKKHKSWTHLEPSRLELGYMSFMYARNQRKDGLVDFFKKYVLVPDLLYFHWAKYLNNSRVRYNALEKKLKNDLKNPKESNLPAISHRDRLRLSVLEKRRKKALVKLAAASKEQKEREKIKVGLKGPLKTVYEWISKGLKESVDPNIHDQVLDELEILETNVVFSLPVSDRLTTKMDDSSRGFQFIDE